jgi:hypothetical protein
MPDLQSKDKEMKWIDVQDQLPRDGEEVWVCALPMSHLGGYDGKYQQLPGKFSRDFGWMLPYGGKVHYWLPKPITPPHPAWYTVSLHDG